MDLVFRDSGDVFSASDCFLDLVFGLQSGTTYRVEALRIELVLSAQLRLSELLTVGIGLDSLVKIAYLFMLFANA